MTETTKEAINLPARLGLVAAAVICTILVWLSADLMGLDVAVTMNGGVQAIGGVTVAVSAAVACLAAWAVKVATERMLRHPLSWWLTISTAVGVLSLVGPLTMATSAAASVALVVMHLVPAAILIPGLARTGQRSTASAGSGYGGAP